jgi:DNA-binding MarR family transcriptional regulator
MKKSQEEARTFGFLLRGIYDALAVKVYGELARKGYGDVRPAHSAVFRNIDRDGTRPTVLAERAGMTKQSMAHLLEGLEKGGYVTLEPDPLDGRARLACLTDRGRDAYAGLVEISLAVESEVSAAVGVGRYGEFRLVLEEVFERVTR